MEFDSGYKDRLVMFSRTMAHWYKRYEASRSMRQKRALRMDRVRLPVDRACAHWILHLLDCAAAPPAARARLSTDPSQLLDFDGKSVLLLTDASSLPLGFDMLPQGWASSLENVEAVDGETEGAVAEGAGIASSLNGGNTERRFAATTTYSES